MNTSSEPFISCATAMSLPAPPSEAHPLHPPDGVRHWCHTTPPPPRAKISRRPSAFSPTVIWETQPPRVPHAVHWLLFAAVSLANIVAPLVDRPMTSIAPLGSVPATI